ncbi:MAG: hypothetical protein NUV65_04000 [Candidatus Roizmanbacteria bacterium]|nr:hypothetical protein [Candidatus Roizmanbacteria bacterium]
MDPQIQNIPPQSQFQQPVYQNPLSKIIPFIIVGFILIISTFSAYYLGTKHISKQQIVITPTQPSPTEIIKPTQNISISNNTLTSTPTVTVNNDIYTEWTTYTNSRYSYSLKYPKEFVVEEKEINICPTLNPLTPPISPGCITIEKKGDRVIIYNKNRVSRNGSDAYSEILLKINNKPQVKDEACYSLNKEPPYREIIINGKSLFERIDSNGNFAYLIVDYNKKKDPNEEGFYLYCETIGIPINNYSLLINANIGGVAKEDQEIMRIIIESISF